jgi:hypothetical protein
MTGYGLTRYGVLWHIIDPDRGRDDLSLCGLRLISKGLPAGSGPFADSEVCSNCRRKAR